MPFVTTDRNPAPFTSITDRAIFGNVNFAPFSGLVLPANPSRKLAQIQVVGSGGAVYVGYGAQAGTGFYHALLAPATVENGGNGGKLSETQYLGNIYASGVGRIVAWQGIG